MLDSRCQKQLQQAHHCWSLQTRVNATKTRGGGGIHALSILCLVPETLEWPNSNMVQTPNVTNTWEALTPVSSWHRLVANKDSNHATSVALVCLDFGPWAVYFATVLRGHHFWCAFTGSSQTWSLRSRDVTKSCFWSYPILEAVRIGEHKGYHSCEALY